MLLLVDIAVSAPFSFIASHPEFPWNRSPRADATVRLSAATDRCCELTNCGSQPFGEFNPTDPACHALLYVPLPLFFDLPRLGDTDIQLARAGGRRRHNRDNGCNDVVSVEIDRG